jgi:hypothetical protein
MLFSMMQQLHENLPCSQNFFKLKKKYDRKNGLTLNTKSQHEPGEDGNYATLASPKIIRHMSVCSQSSNASGSQKSGGSGARTKKKI